MSTVTDLNNEIQDFNKMYYDYIACGGEDDCIIAKQYNSGSVMTNDAFLNIIDASYNSLVVNLKKNITGSSTINGATVFGSVANYSSGIDTGSDEYQDNYNDIISQNLENVKKRKELESQIKDIQHTPDSIYAEKKRTTDLTIYTNIILTTFYLWSFCYIFKIII